MRRAIGIGATIALGGGAVLIAAIALGMRRLVSDFQHAEEWDWTDWPDDGFEAADLAAE